MSHPSPSKPNIILCLPNQGRGGSARPCPSSLHTKDKVHPDQDFRCQQSQKTKFQVQSSTQQVQNQTKDKFNKPNLKFKEHSTCSGNSNTYSSENPRKKANSNQNDQLTQIKSEEKANKNQVEVLLEVKICPIRVHEKAFSKSSPQINMLPVKLQEKINKIIQCTS